jgi:hypothetical protein
MDNKLTWRSLSLGLPLSMGLLHLATDVVAVESVVLKDAGSPARPKVAMLVYNDMILLDLAGPVTVFARP